MLIISKEEHLHSKLVSLATLSQVNYFFLLSLKSTKVLSYKAGYFFTASFNLSSISLDTSFHLLFFFVPSFILYFTQNSLSLCYIACVCYFTIHTIKLQTNLWSILLHVRKLSNFFWYLAHSLRRLHHLASSVFTLVFCVRMRIRMHMRMDL